MKRIVLSVLAVIILAPMAVSPGLGAGPAHGGGESLFLQLDVLGLEPAEGMTRADTAGAFEHQQVLQMDRVIRLLVHLQSQGLIASFEPRLDANGILVATTGPAGRAALGSSPGLYTTVTASEEALVDSAAAFDEALRSHARSVATATEDSGAAGISWTGVQIGSNRIWGYVDPNTPVVVRLKDPEGVVRSRTRAVSGGDGYWQARFRNWLYPYPGCRVIVTSGGTTESIKVPRLSITAHRNSDVSSGKGPKSTTVNVGFCHERLTASGWDCDWYDHDVGTDASGNYSYDFTADANMVGDDWTRVGYSPDASWWIERGVTVPYVGGVVADSWAWGVFNPLTEVTVILKTSAGAERARDVVRTDYGGWFNANFFDANGDPVIIRAGNKVTVTEAGITATMIDLTASANAADDTVSGKAASNKRVQVGLRNWTSEWDSDYYLAYPQCDSAGNYSADFTSQVDMAANDSGWADYRKPATGDYTETWFIAP